MGVLKRFRGISGFPVSHQTKVKSPEINPAGVHIPKPGLMDYHDPPAQPAFPAF
jgi:hypothetical protein